MGRETARDLRYRRRHPSIRRPSRMRLLTFELRGDYITLDALLKATGLASSGGQAKAMIADAMVLVDGRSELRKSCKIRAGQIVALQGAQVRVTAAGAVASPNR